MAAKDPWHYPRSTDAKNFISNLDSGLSNRLILVAPRRKGKTEFLLFDLAPAAEKAGYQVVYASLWANINAPQHGLIEALEMAAEAKRKNRSITKNVLTTAVNKLKVDALGVGAELEFSDRPLPVASDDTARIDRLIDTLAAGRRTKLLLILDEVQHLGTDKAFRALVYALRSTLDRLRDVRVVFSGSSRGGIRRMFGDQDAPFFGSATEVPLPELDEKFTGFLAKTFQKITQRAVDPKSLWTQFRKLDHNPFYIREALKLTALEPNLPISDAIDRVLQAVANQNDYAGLWHRLNPLERLIFQTISHRPGETGLHSQESVDAFTERLGKNVTRAQVGRRLQRLSELNLVSASQRGVYQVEMPGFAEWVKRQDEV